MKPADLGAFLHSADWEMFLRASGNEVEREGGALYIKGKIPRGGTYWRVSRIDIDESWTPPAFTKSSWFVRLEPISEASLHLAKFGTVRPTESVQPKQTLVLDLRLSEEELLAQMKPKHRYNIKVAERHGVEVEFKHFDAAEHFDRFWKLLTETAGRHAFRTHQRDYYKQMVKTLAPKGIISLGFAKLGHDDVATMLFIRHEKVVTYLHGGSSSRHKEVMAPYLLHWHAIRWAKEMEVEAYDFWGTNAIEQEGAWVPRVNHPSTGTTRFKLGFGGTVVQFPGAVDLVLKPIPYTLYSTIRRVIRRQSSF